MSTQYTQFNQNQKNPPFQNSRTIAMNKVSIPEKKISSELILKLFSEVSSGNYLKIKDFLLANQTAMTSRSDTGDSVLHLIISNSNITEKEKLQLVNLAIKEGTPLNLSNENNITPLHLACKYQLYDVIDLLLKFGAVINFEDSQFKTPLHYAVVGDSTQCLSEDDTKVKALIPKTHIKSKEIESDSDMINLQTHLKKFLSNDPNTRKFILHIANTLNNIENMYPFDFDLMKAATRELISSTIIDNSLKGDKSKAIFERVMNDKKKMLDFIISKAKNGVSPLEIKPGIYEGWGPNQYQSNRVLKYRELNEFLVDIHLLADNEIQEANMEAAELRSNIDKRLKVFTDAMTDCSHVIQFSHYYCKVIGIHINDPRMRNLYILSDLLFTSDPIKPIDSTILQYPGKIFPDYQAHDESVFLVRPEWDNVNRRETMAFQPNGLPPIIYMRLDNIKTLGHDRPLVRIRMPRISTDNLEIRKKRHLQTDEYGLTDEFPLKVGPTFMQPGAPGAPGAPLLQIGNDLELRENSLEMSNIYHRATGINSKGLYFNTTAKILVSITTLSNNLFHGSMNLIAKYITEKRFDEAYLAINQCLISVLSMILSISELDTQIPILRDKFNELQQFFDSKKQILEQYYPNHIFLVEQISTEIKNVLDDHISILTVACDNFYGTAAGVIKLLNKYLSTIEKSSVATIFDSFYKTTNFDTWYESQLTELFENIVVNSPFELIPNLPNNLTDFRKLKSATMAETKKTLITNYVSQISLKNLISFYKNALVAPVVTDQKPQLGFIQLFVGEIQNQAQTDPNINTPLEAVRTLDIANNGYTSSLQIKELRTANARGTDPFENANGVTLIGHTGRKNLVQTNKTDALPAIIGLELNHHLVMLKYSIVRRVITQIYEYIDYTNRQQNMIAPTTVLPALMRAPLAQVFAPLLTAIIRMKTKIESLVHFEQNNYSFLFVLIGKYIDEVLINIINELINNKVNKIALNLLETNDRIPRSYIDEFNTRMVFPNKDIGLSVDMNKLFNSTLGMYTKLRFVMSRKNNLITAGELNDPINVQKKESNIVKLINFNHAINSAEKTCFKVDPKIVKLLLSKGAYVNSKDIIGNTPIYYAIEMQNQELIDLLLSNGAVVFNPKFDNKFGKNILDNTWESYAMIVNTLMANKYEVCDVLTKNLINKFNKQGNYKNNIPRYSDILLSVSLYMLNHQLYVYGKSYPNNWSFQKNIEFEKILNLDTSKVLPLLDNITITENEMSRLEVPNLYIQQLEKTIGENKEKIIDLIKKKQNIVDEQNMLINIRRKTDGDKKRLYEIGTIDNDLQIEITNITATITADEQILNNIKSTRTKAHNRLKNFINKHKKKLSRSKDNIVNTYESVFKNVINNDNNNILNDIYDYSVDVKTYPMIWKKFMEETKNKLANCNCQSGFLICEHDYTQILDNIFCYQQQVLSDNISNDVKLEKLKLIIDYYQNIITPFATDYFDLPKEHNPVNSYALTQVIDIIVHIVKRFVCVTLFGTIIKGLSNYVINEFPSSTYDKSANGGKNDYQNYVLNIIVNTINDNGDGSVGGVYGSRLLKYIFETLPNKIVKVVLQIFEGPDSEFDPDRQLSVEQIFDYINKILESTTALNLPANNTLSSGLKMYVYPYYGDYLELFIKEIYNLISNYLRSLQHQAKTLKILESVTLKAVQEMDRLKNVSV